MNAFTDSALRAGHYPTTPGYKEGTTSKEAAAAAAPSAGKIREQALRQIAARPLTADEVGVALDVDILVARPRVSELRKRGLVTPLLRSDGRQERRANESEKSAIVWRATDAGLAALREGTVR